MSNWAVTGVIALLGLACVAVLAALLLRLWRQTRSLGRTVGAASTRLAEASAALEVGPPSHDRQGTGARETLPGRGGAT